MKKTPNLINSCSLICFVGVNLLSHAYPALAQDAEAASPQTLPEVKVTGEAEQPPEEYKEETISTPRIPTKRLDTPQSITIIPEKLLEDQGVTTLRDALRDVSGISLSAGEGGNQGDNLTLRGFSARSDIYLDGMRDFGSYSRDPFMIESVEVLKGPTSALFGRGSTGGIVNQALKTPKAKAFGEGSFMVGTDNTRRGTADINRPFGESAAFRLNLMGHSNDVAGRDITENRRFGIAPAITLGLGGPTQMTIKYLHQSENNIPDYGLPYLNSRPAPVDESNFYGFKENFLRTNVDVVTLKIEHDFGNGLQLRNQLRHANYARDYQISVPRIPASVTPETPVETIQVTRGQIKGHSVEEAVDNDLSLLAKFETGPAVHNLVVGVEAIRETSKPKRYTVTGVPDTSLEEPTSQDPYSGTAALSSDVDTKAVTMAGYLVDAIQFSESWIFNAGLRWDTIKSDYEQKAGNTPAELSRTDKELSWRSGLTFKPAANTSIYANYGTSFNPSIENLSLSASTKDLDPEKSRSYEIGTKMNMLDNLLTMEAAVFRIEKINARTPSLDDPQLNVLDGEHRVDGFELGVIGRPSPRLQVSSGYTWLESEVVETNREGEKGQTLSNTPKHSGNVWVSYILSENVDFGAGVISVAERVGSTTPDAATGKIRKVDGYVTVQAMGQYHVSQDLDVQLNVLNLTNEEYYDTLHPGHIIPGAGRTVLLSSRFKL